MSGVDGNIKWFIDPGTMTLTISGKGSMNDYELYGAQDLYDTSGSTAPWFDSAELYWDNQPHIKSIVVEDGVTSIGNYAFYHLTQVTSIQLPAQMERIGKGAFAWSNAESLVIPKGLTKIEDQAFYYMQNNTFIEIPSGVTEIGVNAFSGNAKAISLTLPSTVSTINDGAFANCKSIQSLSLPTKIKKIGAYAFDGAKGLKELVIPAGCDVGKRAFRGVAAKRVVISDGCVLADSVFEKTSIQSLIMPYRTNPKSILPFIKTTLSEVEIYGQTGTLEDGMFEDFNALTVVTLPNGLERVPDRMFRNCGKLKSVTLSNSTREIGKETFYGCASLESVYVSGNITKIEDQAFSYCANLTGMTVNENVMEIGNGAFYGCSNLDMSLSLPHLTKLGQSAFCLCSKLTSVSLNDNITKIPDFVFSGCKNLTSVKISERVDTIGKYAFYGCAALKTFRIPPAVNCIGQHAFNGCQLERVVLPEGLRNLEYCLFYNNMNLRYIYIPSSVGTISKNCFNGCEHLDTVVNYAHTPPHIDETVFSNYGVLMVAEEDLYKYKSSDYWCKFNIIGTSTDIPPIKQEEGTSLYHDLMGNSVFQQKKGIYIKNGQKVLIGR